MKNHMSTFKVLLFFPTFVLFVFCEGGDRMLLKIGTTAPDFSLISHTGDTIHLNNFRNKKYVVLIFYPGDETPVCTKQLCEIRDNYEVFYKRDAVVFGVNPAGKQSHTLFANKHNFQFPLLIDIENKTTEAYGCKGLVMIKRTVYVINKKGEIIYAKRGKPPISNILTRITSYAR